MLVRAGLVNVKNSNGWALEVMPKKELRSVHRLALEVAVWEVVEEYNKIYDCIGSTGETLEAFIENTFIDDDGTMGSHYQLFIADEDGEVYEFECAYITKCNNIIVIGNSYDWATEKNTGEKFYIRVEY